MASGSGKGSGGLAHVSEFVDNAVNHVEGAFSTLNNIFSEATGQVFHKLSGGKIDKYEVKENVHSVGQAAKNAATELNKRAEHMVGNWVPRPNNDVLVDDIDPAMQEFFVERFNSEILDEGTQNQELLKEMRQAFSRKPKDKRAAAGVQGTALQVEARYMSAIAPQKAKEIRNERSAQTKVSELGIMYFEGRVNLLMLPSFRDCTPELRRLVLHNLVETFVQARAESEKWINSCLYCSQQFALNTCGDGNCLSNACSLGVWGVNDRDKQLRRAIQASMTNPGSGREIRQRFDHQLEAQGLGPDSWEKEWQTEMKVFGDDRRYLSDVHAFVLANVLRRPIIIYGSVTTMLGGLAGIYLPVLWKSSECSPVPVCVLYDASHFRLLAVIEGESPTGDYPLIQLTTAGHLPLPVRFCLPGEDPEELMERYMAVLSLPDGAKGSIFQGRAEDNALVKLLAAKFGRGTGR